MELIKTTPKEQMRYKSVNISKLENGYLVGTITTQIGKPPIQEDYVFTDFAGVIEFLSPQRAKLVS